MKERRRQTRHLGIVLENYTTFIAHFQELPFYTLSVVRKSLLAGGDFDILPAEKSAIGEQLLARSVRSNVQGSVRKNDSLPDGRLTRCTTLSFKPYCKIRQHAPSFTVYAAAIALPTFFFMGGSRKFLCGELYWTLDMFFWTLMPKTHTEPDLVLWGCVFPPSENNNCIA